MAVRAPPDLGRRAVLTALPALGLGLGLGTLASHAQAQPAQAGRIVVGFPAGGTADSLARILAPLLAAPGSSVIVENKPGTSGQLAAEAVRQAAADGQTMLLTPSSVLSLVPQLYRKPMFDSAADFAPVGCLCDHSFGFAVQGNSPFTTFAEFASWAKSQPQRATFATPGPGTAPHFLGTLLGRGIGVPMVHVPYKGVAPGLQDLMGGQVTSTLNPLPTLLEYHRTGRIRILAVTNPRRVASLPAVPTFTELGLPAIELVEWYGLFATSKVPAAVIAQLQERLALATAKVEMRDAARRLEVEPRTVDSAGLAALLAADRQRWSTIVRATGITLDT